MVKMNRIDCPNSTDRVCQIAGTPSNIRKCVMLLLEDMEKFEIRGDEYRYDPVYYDESLEYGGFRTIEIEKTDRGNGRGPRLHQHLNKNMKMLSVKEDVEYYPYSPGYQAPSPYQPQSPAYQYDTQSYSAKSPVYQTSEVYNYPQQLLENFEKKNSLYFSFFFLFFIILTSQPVVSNYPTRTNQSSAPPGTYTVTYTIHVPLNQPPPTFSFIFCFEKFNFSPLSLNFFPFEMISFRNNPL